MGEPSPTLAPSAFGGSVLSKSKTDQQGKTGDSKAAVVEQQTVEQGQGDGKPKQKKKNTGKEKRKGKPSKIHIRLPPIEAYEVLCACTSHLLWYTLWSHHYHYLCQKAHIKYQNNTMYRI